MTIRCEGKFNLKTEYERVLPSMSNEQLQFLLKVARRHPELHRQREFIIAEMGNRVAQIYRETYPKGWTKIEA